MNIDELVVELNLDTKKFTQGQKDALDSFRKTDEEMEKRMKSLEASNKNVGYSFNNTTAAAEGLFGALLGAGIATFARDTMTSVAATGRMAANIAVATNEVSAFGRMVERNGGDALTAQGSLKSLNDQVERFKMFGQASDELQMFAGTIGADLNSSPIAMMMKFAEWADKHRDDLKQVNVIGQLGGLDQGTINTLLKGNVQVLKEYNDAMKDAISPEQAQAMIRMQSAWTTLEQKIGDVGRGIVVDIEPAFTGVSNAISNFIEHNHKLAESMGEVIVALSTIKSLAWVLRLLGIGSGIAALPVTAAVGSIVAAKQWTDKYGGMWKPGMFDPVPGESPWGSTKNYRTGNAEAATTATSSGGRDSAAAREARIRSIAASLGINPDIAMRVAHSEGFDNFKSAIPGEKSFGDFQLNMKKGSLGSQFMKQTGLDPSDPANEAKGDEFALKWVSEHGWHDFHGAARTGVGDMQGIRTGPISVTIQTASSNPREHGRLAAEEIKKGLGSTISTQANMGLNN